MAPRHQRRCCMSLFLLCGSFAPASAAGSNAQAAFVIRPPIATIKLHLRPTFPRHTSKFLQAPSNMWQDEVEALDGGSETSPVETLALVTWISTMSAVLLVNYFGGSPWPENIMLDTPFRTWSLLHAVSGMLFSGTILVSTLVEWSVVASRQAAVLRFWFWTVPQLDAMIVLPALTGTVLSGVAQACHLYGSFAMAPKHVTGTVHGLLAFGIWWAVTDVTTQHISKTAVQNLINRENNGTSHPELPPVLLLRRASNVVSCLLILGLYSVMVLKPGVS
jgi:hypothetical protein